MKELIEEFRLLGLAGHTHHRTAEWGDCEYAFCKRRYQLWFAASVCAQMAPPDSVFIEAVVIEIAGSRKKFPSPDANMSAMVEEVGEVAKALMYEPWANVYKECVQVAGCALRLAIEGDVTMSFFRDSKGNDDMPEQCAPAGTPLTDLFPDGIEVEMRGDSLVYVGGKPALSLKEATAEEAEAHLTPERCRFAASLVPMLQCTLNEGHGGVHVREK